MPGKENIRLQTIELSVGYKEPLFRNLNLALGQGTITCLIGRNGAGKSTLIRTLSGMQKPLEGSILLENKDINRLTEKEISGQLSVVLTHPIKVPYMTVEDLVVFGRYPHLGGQVKLSPRDREIVDEAIHDTGIEPLRGRYLINLSDGERQKAALARSLAQQTPVIMLDEPAAFLDFPSKIELMRLLQKLSRQFSKSILLSTHDIEMAVALADYLWLIDNERQFLTGTPKGLLDSNAVSATFGIPPSFFEAAINRYQF